MIQAKVEPNKFRISVVLIQDGKTGKFTVDIHNNKFIRDLNEKECEQILYFVQSAVKENFVFDPAPRNLIEENVELQNQLASKVDSLIAANDELNRILKDKNEEIETIVAENITLNESLESEKIKVIQRENQNKGLESVISGLEKRVIELTDTLSQAV